MPLNSLHAFSNGPAFARPAARLFPDVLLRLTGLLERLALRYTAEKVWAQFERNAVVGPDCRLGPSAWCVNAGPREAISLGPNVVCRGVLRRETFGAGKILLHDHVYVGDDVLISCAAQVEIGHFTLLAHGVQVFDNDSHPTDAGARAAHFREILAGRQIEPPIAAAPVVIGERAWVGVNSFVGKGVTVGDESIVAAGSVVTRDVPPRSLAAGNPAQVVKSL